MSTATILKQSQQRHDGAVLRLPVAQSAASDAVPTELAPVPIKSVAEARAASPYDADAFEHELAALRAAAREKGLQDGLKDAEDRIERGIKQEQAALGKVLVSLEKLTRDVHARYEAAMADIVMVALVRLLGKQLATPEGVIAHLKSVLTEAGLDGMLAIEMHPRDIALVEGAVLSGELSLPSGVSLVTSQQVQAGGCRIVTSAGTVDGLLETQLATLRRELVGPDKKS